MTNHDALPEWDDLPVGLCPNCVTPTLRPVESDFEEIERQVLHDTDTELWACACGYTEERAPGSGELPPL